MEIASAFVSLLPSMKGFGASTSRQLGPQLNSAGKTAGSRFGKVFASASMGPMRAIGTAALGFFAVDKISGFLSDSVTGLMDHQKVLALTANTIKTTGGAANVTAKQVGSLSDAIERRTGVDGDAVQGAANMLLTFTNVRNEVGKGNKVFDQATKIVTDMSVALGTDAKGSALQVGKALNDPIKGVSALSRVGVSFTEQQKAQIKALVDSGNTMKAQKIILGELGKEFGGAAAAAKTPADDLRTAYHGLQDQVGSVLLPLVTKGTQLLTNTVVPAFSSFVTQIQTGTGAGGALATVVKTVATNFGTIVPVIGVVLAGMGAYRVASLASAAASVVQAAGTTAATGATWSLNAALRANPIGLVVTALTALGVGLVIAYKKSDTFRGVVDTLFGVLKKVWGVLMNNKQAFLALLGPVGLVAAVLITAYKKSDTFRGGVQAAIGALKTFGGAVIDGARKVGEFAGKVGNAIGKVIGFFRDLPGKIKSAIGDAGSMLVGIGGDIVAGLKRGLEGAWHLVTDAVTNLINKIPKKIREIMGIASPAKVTIRLAEFMVDGLVLPFRKGGGKLQAAVKKLLEKGVDRKLISTYTKNGLKGLVIDWAAVVGAKGKKGEKALDAMRDRLEKSLERLRTGAKKKVDDLQGTLDGMRSFASNIASTFKADLFSGTLSDFFKTGIASNANLQAVIGGFKKLIGAGYDKGFLSALIQSGNTGLILELAAADSSIVGQAQDVFGMNNSLTSQLGNISAEFDRGQSFKGVEDRLDQLIKKFDNMPGKVGASVGKSLNTSAAKGKKNQRKDKKK